MTRSPRRRTALVGATALLVTGLALPVAARSAVPTTVSAARVPAAVSRPLVPLWPFTGVAAAQAWQRRYHRTGAQPWHLDVRLTVQGFTQGYLGFTGLRHEHVRWVRPHAARVAVGFLDPSGRPAVAAVVCLRRLGTGPDAPWEVVGTADTTLTLDRPAYGTTVTSPVRVSGLITGVDEQIVVVARQSWRRAPLGRTQGLPAGGDRTRWSTTLRFADARPGAVTVVARTGGHLRAVERFAVTGVYAR